MRKKYILSIQKQCLKSLKTFSYKGWQINSCYFFSVASNTAKDDCATCIAFSLFTNSTHKMGTEFVPNIMRTLDISMKWRSYQSVQRHDFLSLKKRGSEIRVKLVDSDRLRHAVTPDVLIPMSILIQWSALRIVSYSPFSWTCFFLAFRSFISDPANGKQGSVTFGTRSLFFRQSFTRVQGIIRDCLACSYAFRKSL